MKNIDKASPKIKKQNVNPRPLHTLYKVSEPLVAIIYATVLCISPRLGSTVLVLLSHNLR